MSSDQPQVNFRQGDWEFPTEGTAHPLKVLALVEGSTVTSKVHNKNTRTITFKKGTFVTLTVNSGSPLATWNPSDALTDTHTG